MPFKWLGLTPDLIVKIFGPILYGSLIVSFYCFVRNFLKFSPLKSFLVGLLLIFQLATLRLSWDLYRNELGLIFLFWALINLGNLKNVKNWFLVAIFSILVALSNELVTVILLVTLMAFFFLLLKKRKFVDLPKISVPLISAGLIFYLVINSSGQILYDPRVIFTSESNYLVWRYFYQYQKEMSYHQLFQTIIALFWLFYQFLLPFALYGFWLMRKNLILTILTLWLLAGTFSALILGGTGIIVWVRWLIMLAFPFAIYAVEGIFKLQEFIAKHWPVRLKYLVLSLGILFWLGFLGLFVWRAWPFLTATYQKAKPPLANDGLNEYFPRTMVHNSIGINRIENTLRCIHWLNLNAPSGATILVDNRYRGLVLTSVDLDGRSIITTSWSENWPKNSFKFAKSRGYWPIYLLWNNTGAIKGFELIHANGNVGIFEAKPY